MAVTKAIASVTKAIAAVTKAITIVTKAIDIKQLLERQNMNNGTSEDNKIVLNIVRRQVNIFNHNI